jgi:type IV secretory pathway VirB10-like protein
MRSCLGLQLGQLGMQLAQRELDIQPTLEIRPGYRFNIMVTKDVVIRPWKQ